MSIDGFSQVEIVNLTSQYGTVTYVYAAAITLVVYDSLILFRREVNYIYRASPLLVKWIYILIKVIGLTIFLLDFFTYYTWHKRPMVSYTAIIKTLLVLRLRALYQNSRGVTIILYLATALEVMSTTYAFLMAGLNIQWYTVAPAPVPGCPLGPQNQMSHFHSPIVAWGTRVASSSLEILLLLVALYRNLRGPKNCFLEGWKHTKQIAPVLYVFYRDGTLFYIPVFGLSIFGFVAAFDTHLSAQIPCANWEAWLAIAYYIAGTRLILNIRSAGLKFTMTMISQPISSLGFNNGSSSTESGDDHLGLA
ncbi:hypothetical protein P691DRAFT_775198 [Macrolepiota fuliginosa MF-IS2]|uniref:DUF6533 domain-containing protein n=1 Tax=Macrolepiota fuliginosa MF-IS2 TaxID=1400762 RepID=A0A9P5XGB1_9AGAR|nr:hypothetical protein P691DRAFT_775198 [Macrolepiota fuliginosa MF-IS2]